MADIALTTKAAADRRISVVHRDGAPPRSFVAAEAITAGAPFRQDTGNGKATNANALTAAEARFAGIALNTASAGQAVDYAKRGDILDGFDLSAMAFDAPVYLSDTDGRLANTVPATAGAVTVVVGRVVPGTATTLGTTYDKLLEVTLGL